MNKKIISVFLIVLVVGLVGTYLVVSKKADTMTPPVTSAPHETLNPSDTTATPAETAGTPATTGKYTMADVAAHNSASSCWTVINGNVYDVTSWIYKHPGGARAITALCGTDGSAAFSGQHGGQARPENELVGFKIGSL